MSHKVALNKTDFSVGMGSFEVAGVVMAYNLGANANVIKQLLFCNINT